MARANPTRFRMPPESSTGYFSSISAIPTSVKTSPTRSRISLSGIRVCSLSGKATFSFTLNESKRAAP